MERREEEKKRRSIKNSEGKRKKERDIKLATNTYHLPTVTLKAD
jgi:hypothetical protein